MNDDRGGAAPEPPVQKQVAQRPGNLLVLAALALVVGAASGLVGALFRLSLQWADVQRDHWIAWAHGGSFAGLLLVIGVSAAAVAIAAWLVRRFSPHASGSGIPHVEAVLQGELPPAPPRLLGVKFVGGFLAIGFGLALGREGPSVQMGANIGYMIGRICRSRWPECRILLAAGAGAGLATAFNSPIAGAVFVLEELVRKFELRIAIAALGASAAAISVARVFLGIAPDFDVQTFMPASARAEVIPLYMALGAVAGLIGVAYNRTLLGALAIADRFGRFPLELRAAVVGGAVGALAFFAPGLVGGGDPLTQSALAGVPGLWLLPFVFLVRFGLGAVSYAAGTPGGLFAPLLVLGAQLGLFFGMVCALGIPTLGVPPQAFAVVGMGALFTAIVRAPLTGIVLVIEMTAAFVLLLPLLGACFAAMLVATLLRNDPIYDSLRERTLRSFSGR
jgi:chloride channel protein, CIC family